MAYMTEGPKDAFVGKRLKFRLTMKSRRPKHGIPNMKMGHLPGLKMRMPKKFPTGFKTGPLSHRFGHKKVGV